jgi:hypothetical protein
MDKVLCLPAERPTSYIKGPDVMSKSERTRYRYADSFKDQARLDVFFQPRRPAVSGSESSIPQARKVSDRSISSSSDSEELGDYIEIIDASPSTVALADHREGTPSVNRDVSVGLSTIPESELTTGTPTAPDDNSDSDSEDEKISDDGDATAQSPEERALEMEAFEEELDANVYPAVEIRDWATLQVQIKANLKKNSRKLALSEINKLMIICNFATLRLKGRSRMEASLEVAAQWHEGDGVWFSRKIRALARHYQIFEELPIEQRGGLKNARTLLQDELVKKRILDHLQSLPTGKITPKKLRAAVNTEILPDLGITPKNPISTRTARRWLIKLGWRYTQVRKGVYMDGHERADVVKYRQEVFLPLMAQFEARMAHYEGQELNRVAPILQPGEREIIPNFHDESTFHANEEVRSLWLRKGEQPLRKKGRGRLIHVSAFINPETGRLVLLDQNEIVVRDSTKIIYPGSKGDAWWDCEQLMKQIEEALQIFEAAHPGKQGLFIFDQSSAHASLPPDALKAFEMNKSDGGKQRRQRDTIIPETNPVAEHRGKPQKMILPDGRPKGLQRVLEERGFNVKNLRSKCSPVCPIDNQNCCLARLLGQQDDFKNQESRLETFIRNRGHECIFLPKFHCELNPIEMVSDLFIQSSNILYLLLLLVLGMVQVPLP